MAATVTEFIHTHAPRQAVMAALETSFRQAAHLSRVKGDGLQVMRLKGGLSLARTDVTEVSIQVGRGGYLVSASSIIGFGPIVIGLLVSLVVLAIPTVGISLLGLPLPLILYVSSRSSVASGVRTGLTNATNVLRSQYGP